MKIFLGSDHNGFEFKQRLKAYLQQRGYEVVDKGDERLDPNDDFPQFAGRLASAVLGSDEKDPRGILLCGSGQGMCMAANRFKGIRAALVWNQAEARMARNDDDSNVLCLPTRLLKNEKEMEQIVDTWLDTPFAAATRYMRRNKELDELT